MACRRRQKVLECEECGEEFKVGRARDDARFCSRACYRKSEAASTPEILARLCLDELSVRYRTEHPVGRYSVDFLLVEFGIALEIDGDYWHRNGNAKKDRAVTGAGYSILRVRAKDLVEGGTVLLARAVLGLIASASSP